MVNLHHWLRRTSPHLVVIGSLIISGLSGCRSTRPAPVAFESPSPTYSAPPAVPDGSSPPLTVPEARTNNGLDASQTTADKELFLDPPEPPAVKGGTGNGYDEDVEELVDPMPVATATPPVVPLPEPQSQEEFSESASLANTVSEPFDNSLSSEEDVSGVSSDPLDATNLFPDDARKTRNGSTEAAETLDLNALEATSDSDFSGPEFLQESTGNPFTRRLESSNGNPEVPVPDPNQKGTKISLPEVEPAELP